ncbi:MAG: hypothetical protein AAF939_20615 [Planctomycetota bacterium]
MNRWTQSLPVWTAVIAVFAFTLGGCAPPEPNADGGSSSASDHDHDHGDHDHGDHDHDGDHDHGHDDHAHDHPPHGPNHGHIFDLDTDGHQGEWCKYPDNNVIRMFILDAKGKKNVPVKIDSFTVRPKVGADEEEFVLEPEEANENGETATYKLDDEDLYRAIPLGVDIEIKSGDQTWKGEIKAHKPLDH